MPSATSRLLLLPDYVTRLRKHRESYVEAVLFKYRHHRLAWSVHHAQGQSIIKCNVNVACYSFAIQQSLPARLDEENKPSQPAASFYIALYAPFHSLQPVQ